MNQIYDPRKDYIGDAGDFPLCNTFAVENPIVFRFQSDKFPNNNFDVPFNIASIVQIRTGVIEIDLNSYHQYREGSLVIIEGVVPTSFNKVYRVSRVVDGATIQISGTLPFNDPNYDVSAATLNTHYQNYYIGVDVWAGFTDDHKWNILKPMRMVGRLKAVPDVNGIATFDVSELVKTRVDFRNRIPRLASLPNDISLSCEFYLDVFEGFLGFQDVNGWGTFQGEIISEVYGGGTKIRIMGVPIPFIDVGQALLVQAPGFSNEVLGIHIVQAVRNLTPAGAPAGSYDYEIDTDRPFVTGQVGIVNIELVSDTLQPVRTEPVRIEGDPQDYLAVNAKLPFRWEQGNILGKYTCHRPTDHLAYFVNDYEEVPYYGVDKWLDLTIGIDQITCDSLSGSETFSLQIHNLNPDGTIDSTDYFDISEESQGWYRIPTAGLDGLAYVPVGEFCEEDEDPPIPPIREITLFHFRETMPTLTGGSPPPTDPVSGPPCGEDFSYGGADNTPQTAGEWEVPNNAFIAFYCNPDSVPDWFFIEQINNFGDPIGTGPKLASTGRTVGNNYVDPAPGIYDASTWTGIAGAHDGWLGAGWGAIDGRANDMFIDTGFDYSASMPVGGSAPYDQVLWYKNTTGSPVKVALRIVPNPDSSTTYNLKRICP